MRVAVIGANGQLGHDVVAAFTTKKDEVLAVNHSDIELSSIDSVSAKLKELCPQLIVNTAAMHHVENCERQPDRAFAVNGIGSRNLAVIAAELNATLMHVSTDYVFDGSKRNPYEESDAPNPLNVYGNTKLSGEHFVRATVPKHFVVRTAAIYGKSPCRAKGGLNFIELMLKLARERGELRVIDSEWTTPTSTLEIARQLVSLSRSEHYGLYHATAEGSCSWYEFAHEIFSIMGTRVKLEVAGANEFPSKVPRPKYSVLENSALKRNNLNIFKPWQESVREYLSSCQ
jgi:dTDP-4-dehydrorhamnose reductase